MTSGTMHTPLIKLSVGAGTAKLDGAKLLREAMASICYPEWRSWVDAARFLVIQDMR